MTLQDLTLPSQLVQQFLEKQCNHRDDSYGGSVANRVRFGLEVTDAVVAAVGASRTGIRLSPYTTFQGISALMPLSNLQGAEL